MKCKFKLLILISILLISGLIFSAFKFGEKQAYSKIPEISLRGSMKFDETTQKEIIEKANEHIKKNSVEGITYFLTVSREQGNWIVFEIHPLKPIIDNAFLYVEVKDGLPVFYGPGTSFPDLAEKHPELFR